MTERLYFTDSYVTEFEASVVERSQHDGQPALILDRTHFYPESGGQPADRGFISGVPVEDVFIREEDGAIVHVLSDEVWSDEIAGEVSWARRFDHMQQHSGQHILSQAFIEVAGARTVGFHLSENSVTIDLHKSQLTPEEVEKAELLANQIVWENRAVRVHLVSRTEAAALSRRDVPPVEGDTLRLIEIEDFDTTACGGTHVSQTGAVGLIKVVNLENVRDELRVAFCCGRRALLDYRRKNRTVSRLAAEFTTGYWEVEQAVANLREEAKNARKEAASQRAELMHFVVEKLLASAQEINGTRIITRTFEDRGADDLKVLAKHFLETRNAVALLGLAGEKSQLIFVRGQNAPGKMNELIKPALQVLGSAAGGGSPNFAQGGGPEADVDRVQNALSRAKRLLLAQIH